MGLLDDAIREHLELKRRHGADPGEVARQEREALTPEIEPGAEEQGTPTILPRTSTSSSPGPRPPPAR